jgi:hypothetical protein
VQTGVFRPENVNELAKEKRIFQQVGYYRWAGFSITEGNRPECVDSIKTSLDLLPMFRHSLRWAGTISGGFDYRLRGSYQSGHLADNTIAAWAYYGILGYTIPGTRLEPRFSIEYNYASGKRSLTGPVTATFDQLYPTTHQWMRITDLFGEQNSKDLKPGFSFAPAKKMKVCAVYMKPTFMEPMT